MPYPVLRSEGSKPKMMGMGEKVEGRSWKVEGKRQSRFPVGHSRPL
jgi:hypothetical protein